MAELAPEVKRVLLLAPPMEPRGTSEYGLNLARELKRREVDVTLFCAPGSRPGTLDRAQIPVQTFACLDSSLLHLMEGKRFIRAVQDFNPQVVHVQSVAVAAGGRSLRRQLSAPIVLTVHSRPKKSRKFRKACRQAGGIIVTSQSLREELVNRAGVDKSKIRVITNGIDVEHLTSRRVRPIFSSQVPVVGSVGPAEQQRGHELFIEAAARLIRSGVDCQFVVAGKGDQVPALRRLMHKLGLESRMTFVEDFSSYEEVLDAFDVVVQSSLVDVSGFSILESMAQGRPVIAFNTGTACDIIEDQKSGFLVPRGDVDAIAAAIRRSTEDRELARQVGMCARERVRANHDIRAIADQILDFYAHLVAGG